MKKLEFYKMSPGGNTTILIDNSQVDSDKRSTIANKLMDELHLYAEQVGYISYNDEYPRLDMMGGEFCGNASRSLAAMLAFKNHPSLKALEGKLMGEISVSGVSRNLKIKVETEGDSLNSKVEMPIEIDPACIESIDYHGSEIHLARMEGICHVLINEEIISFPSDYENYARKVREELGLTEEEAAGCIWYKQKGDKFRIKPVVWVCATNSSYYETACGSGTVALGLLLAKSKKKSIDILIGQPSQEDIRVEVVYSQEKNHFEKAWIGGQVKIIAHGFTYVY